MRQELSKGAIPCLGEREEAENPGASGTKGMVFEKTGWLVIACMDYGDRNVFATTTEQR